MRTYNENGISYENCILNECICFSKEWKKRSIMRVVNCWLLMGKNNEWTTNNERIIGKRAKNNFNNIIKLLHIQVIFNEFFPIEWWPAVHPIRTHSTVKNRFTTTDLRKRIKTTLTIHNMFVFLYDTKCSNVCVCVRVFLNDKSYKLIALYIAVP